MSRTMHSESSDSGEYYAALEAASGNRQSVVDCAVEVQWESVGRCGTQIALQHL